MKRESFSMTIPEGTERSDGYVELQHNTQYTLVLANESQRLCAVEVHIDGERTGSWRIPPRSAIQLERPVFDSGRFTFYKSGTPEVSAESMPAEEVAGLIRAQFKPQLIIPATTQLKPDRKNIEADDRPLPSRLFCSIVASPQKEGSDKASAGVDDAFSDEALCVDLGESDEMAEMQEKEPPKSNGLLQRFVNWLGIRSEYSPGITALTGHSDQKFRPAKPMLYDERAFVTIHLRLVAVAVRPSRQISTPIPPPIRTLASVARKLVE